MPLVATNRPIPRGQAKFTPNCPLTVTNFIALSTPELPEIHGSRGSNRGRT